MIYVFKKTVAFFLFPYRIGLFMILVGLVLLWSTKRQKTGRWLASIGLGILCIASIGLVSNPMLNRLESRYPPITEFGPYQDVNWVVVLGGGAYPEGNLALLDRLTVETLTRLTEGIRILRQLQPSARILLSGGNPSGKVVEARAMQAAAVALGMENSRLVIEEKSWDTKDQARLIKDIVGQERCILVTSARHMPRAAALFRKQGLQVIPAPVGVIVKDPDESRPQDYLPGVGSLGRTEKAIYEYLGTAWARLRGQM